MTNPFKNRSLSVSGPATDISPIVPNDGVDLPKVAVSLFVETGGTIVVVTVTGDTRTVTVSDYSILPVGIMRVLASGTTAAGIHAFTVS
jgi:hypothetical protein